MSDSSAETLASMSSKNGSILQDCFVLHRAESAAAWAAPRFLRIDGLQVQRIRFHPFALFTLFLAFPVRPGLMETWQPASKATSTLLTAAGAALAEPSGVHEPQAVERPQPAAPQEPTPTTLQLVQPPVRASTPTDDLFLALEQFKGIWDARREGEKDRADRELMGGVDFDVFYMVLFFIWRLACIFIFFSGFLSCCATDFQVVFREARLDPLGGWDKTQAFASWLGELFMVLGGLLFLAGVMWLLCGASEVFWDLLLADGCPWSHLLPATRKNRTLVKHLLVFFSATKVWLLFLRGPLLRLELWWLGLPIFIVTL